MSTTTDTPEIVTPEAPEAGADLSHLIAEAEGIEGAQEQAQAQQAAAQAAAVVENTAAELLGALQMVRAMAAPAFAWWPQFGQVWSDEALQGIAQAGAAVMQRHGWTMSEAWAHLGPYIALLCAVLPPSLVTWQALKARKAAEQQAAQVQQARPMQPQQAEPVHAQQGERVL